MRLAVVSPFVDRRHGTERALAELLERLARTYRCEIHLFSQRVEDLVVTKYNKTERVSAGETGAIVWHKVPSIPGPHLVGFLGWMLCNTVARWFYRFFGNPRWDLVLSPGVNCLDADVIIIHALFHRLSEISRGEASDVSAQTGVLRRLHRRAYYALLTALERRVYSHRNVSLAAVSQRTADLLASYFLRHDVAVIPNGVDTVQFSTGARLARRAEARRRRNFCDTDLVLLLVGNDWQVKGVPAVLAAIAAKPALPLIFLVVGSEAVDSFREMAARLGVLDRYRSESPRPDAIDLYAAADVYVSPSREDSFGLPVAEAMACGLPVITSIFAGVASLIRDGVDGFVLSDPRDTTALANVFARLHGDESLRRRIGDAAARSAHAWTWDRNAEAVWKLLQTFVDEH